MTDPPFDVLRPFERFAFRLVRWLNRSWPGALWQRYFVTPFVGLIVSRRLRLVGLERLDAIEAGAPILLVANHRTFFDLFILGWVLVTHPRLRSRVTFPVRANFFYEGPVGLAVCVFMSGGSMFPPFFRSADKMPFNRYSLSLVIERMKERNWIVGFHPEGTRNKTDDPYQLLPAQPGVGEVALKARPVVVPAFIRGMTNNVWQEMKLMFRRDLPINAVFGAPIDLSDFPKETRLSHHKRCADRFAERIAALGEQEKKLSATSPPALP
jgi:1-acyl-sn-glycerol-3-phosphate acyltransferase